MLIDWIFHATSITEEARIPDHKFASLGPIDAESARGLALEKEQRRCRGDEIHV